VCGNQWYIAQKGIHAKFSDGDAPEIRIEYEVYKKIELDQVHAQVYPFDFSAPAEGATTATSFTTSDTSDPDLKILEFHIDRLGHCGSYTVPKPVVSCASVAKRTPWRKRKVKSAKKDTRPFWRQPRRRCKRPTP
jgi:hypothetical protein